MAPALAAARLTLRGARVRVVRARVVGAGDASTREREARIDLESHRVRSGIDERNFGIHALTRAEIGSARAARGEIGARRYIARRDAIAEAILHRHAQQR